MDRMVKPGENIYPKIFWYRAKRGGFNFRAYFGNESEKSTWSLYRKKQGDTSLNILDKLNARRVQRILEIAGRGVRHSREGNR